MFDKLVDLLISSIQFFQFSDNVKEWEGGIVLRYGKFHRVAKKGWNWIIPFYVEHVFVTGVVDEPMEIGPLSLMTKDGKGVVVTAMMVSTVEDVRKFLTTLEGGNVGAMRIAKGVLAEVVQSHTYEELSRTVGEDGEQDEPKKRWSIATKLTNRLRKRLEQYGAGVSSAMLIELSQAKSLRLWGVSERPSGVTQ